MTRPQKDDLKFSVAGLKAIARKHNQRNYIKLSQRRAELVYDIKSKRVKMPTYKQAVTMATKAKHKKKPKKSKKKKKTKK